MNEPENQPQAIKSSRMKFTALVLIAFVPILIAYLAFFFVPAWAPSGTTNQGELIAPPIDAATVNSELAELGSWVLIQPTAATCNDACQSLMYLSRQVVIGLGKDQGRMQRAVLADGSPDSAFSDHLQAEHPDMKVIQSSQNSLEPGRLYLMDPFGNVMMYYLPEKAGKPMLKDLKHLLKLSNIG